jgi:hypothetical protein
MQGVRWLLTIYFILPEDRISSDLVVRPYTQVQTESTASGPHAVLLPHTRGISPATP